ncbi:MAG: alpha/beta hydrolase [Actinomycetota bacterium]|nr:alpha/beta hydrolase [Actinomycetota bacterium]
MKRRWKILFGFLFVVAVLLAVNAVTTQSQTKEAGTTAEGGRILELSSGSVQVTDSGEAPGQTIVLLHGYANSLHWFDLIEPLLAEEHRVIRVDLIGFGGSEKPESGYSIPEQASTVAEALNRLEVEGAMVVGNSMGGSVATSLAEQASQLVDRVVLIDMAPSRDDFGDGLPFLAKLGYTPVLGEAMWRLTPDFAIRDGFAEAFAPGFDAEAGFEDSDQVVEDFRAMTYTSYDEASAEANAYTAELPLDERLTQTPVPLLVIFGAEDQIFDTELSIEGFGNVPGVQTEVIKDAGHAPQVEKPEEVAKLLEEFAVQPAEVTKDGRKLLDLSPPPAKRTRDKGRKGDG